MFVLVNDFEPNDRRELNAPTMEDARIEALKKLQWQIVEVPNENNDKETKVNIHLIAAAPDLLNACKEFIRCIDVAITVVPNKPTCNLHDIATSEGINEMRAAVAKAEGK